MSIATGISILLCALLCGLLLWLVIVHQANVVFINFLACQINNSTLCALVSHSFFIKQVLKFGTNLSNKDSVSFKIIHLPLHISLDFVAISNHFSMKILSILWVQLSQLVIWNGVAVLNVCFELFSWLRNGVIHVIITWVLVVIGIKIDKIPMKIYGRFTLPHFLLIHFSTFNIRRVRLTLDSNISINIINHLIICMFWRCFLFFFIRQARERLLLLGWFPKLKWLCNTCRLFDNKLLLSCALYIGMIRCLNITVRIILVKQTFLYSLRSFINGFVFFAMFKILLDRLAKFMQIQCTCFFWKMSRFIMKIWCAFDFHSSPLAKIFPF